MSTGATPQETPPPRMMDYGSDDDGPELIDEGNSAIFDLYAEQGKFRKSNIYSPQPVQKPKAEAPGKNMLDVTSRLLEDVKGNAPQLKSVPNGVSPPGDDVERQQPKSETVAPVAPRTSTVSSRASTARTSTARTSTARISTARVSMAAKNGEEGEPPKIRKSLGALKTVDMKADQHQRTGKKNFALCLFVFLLLAGGVIGAAVYFSLDESKK